MNPLSHFLCLLALALAVMGASLLSVIGIFFGAFVFIVLQSRATRR